MSTETVYHLTFLRHAESGGNVQNLFIGRMDSPLTENGRRQAQALAERWAREGVTFDHVISSPLARARDTAQIVAQTHSLAVETDSLWLEQDFGEWNALPISQIVQGQATPRFFTPYDRPGKSGESQMETYLRAGQAIHQLLERPPGRYLIVAHGVILNMALYIMFGIPLHPSAEGPWFQFQNAAFAEIRYNPARYHWTVRKINDHQHLPASLPGQDADAYHFLFVRHGESEGNVNGLWQGQAEFPLTETGRGQARSLAEHLARAGVQFDKAMASPLSRTRETGEIIAQRLGCPLEFDPVWLEWNNGLFAATHPQNRPAPEPDYYTLHQPVGETGETIWEFYLRGGRAIQTLFQQPPGRYLVVAHGGILNMALKAALGIVPFADLQGVRFGLGNTSAASLSYYPARNRWLFAGLEHAPWNFSD